MTADLRALLDRLDTALAAATPGQWREGALAYVYAEGPGSPVVADEVGSADAALIVAAVNALPCLLAAVRAAVDLADSYPLGSDVPVYRIQRALAAALTDGATR